MKCLRRLIDGGYGMVVFFLVRDKSAEEWSTDFLNEGRSSTPTTPLRPEFPKLHVIREFAGVTKRSWILSAGLFLGIVFTHNPLVNFQARLSVNDR